MRKIFIVAACILSIPASAEIRTAQCLLRVDGKTYIDGPCPFDRDANGSFELGGNGDGNPWFAYVVVADDGTARAYWNGYNGEPGNHAHTDLGIVTRDGACWSNARAAICAK